MDEVRDGHGRRPGRPPRVTREAILEAVLEIGIDRATVSAVADRVGVDPSTLYGHVSGRDEMVAAAAESAIARVRWPDPAEVGANDSADHGWRVFLTEVAETLWAMYRQNPGLAGHLRTTVVHSPTLLELSATAVDLLNRDFGVDVPLAALAVDSVGDCVIDSYLTVTRLERAAAGEPGRERRDDAVHALDRSRADIRPEYRSVLRVALGTADGSDAWWRDKVQLVLDGVDHRLSRRERS